MPTSDEAQIRQIIENRVQSVRARDVSGATLHAAPGILLFDVVNPLRYSGSDALRQRTEQWFSSFEGPIGLELRDLAIAAAADVAFSHSLNHVSATTINGQKLDMWWRSTLCFRKIAGEWMITHEHNSVPFDPATGKASLDLQP